MRWLFCIVTIQVIFLVLNCEGNPLTEQVASSAPDRSVRRTRQTRYGPEFGVSSGTPYMGARFEHKSDLFDANARATINSRGNWDVNGGLGFKRNDWKLGLTGAYNSGPKLGWGDVGFDYESDLFDALGRATMDTHGNWGVNGGLGFKRNGWRLGWDGSYNSDKTWSTGGRLSYKNNRWGGFVSGTIDSSGKYGLEAGLSFSIKKRSIENDNERFNVTLQVDPCYFNVYDIDRDGLITFGEFVMIFGPGESAKYLFNALDITTGDGRLEEEEFNVMAPGLIANCRSSLKGR